MSQHTARDASKITLAVMGSRVLGLVREIVLNAVFGAGKELDAFIAAFRFPNLLRDLLAEGALSTAFVTTFTKKMTAEGKEKAYRLANLVLSSMSIIIGVICVLGIFGSEWLVNLITPGFSQIPGKAELTTSLTQIMFPFILLVSLAAVYMGMLNSLGSFGLPASASTVFNATSIITGLILGWCIDPHLGARAIYGFAVGTLLGGAAQWWIQIPKAKSLGYRFRWELDWRDDGLRHVGKLLLPAIAGGAAVQVNVLVNTCFASYLGDGAVTWLNNAFRLMQLPIGMFGVAIGMVTLPSVSRAVAESDMKKFRTNVDEGLRLALFLTLPASIGLAVLASPIISTIYERGAFTASDTLQTALALQAYAIGLASYACIKVLAPTFYALDAPSIPTKVSIIGIFLNGALNYFFIKTLHWGVFGLALSTSLVAVINIVQLYVHLSRKARISSEQGSWKMFFVKMLLACALLAGCAYGVDQLLHATHVLIRLVVGIGAGMAIFALSCHLLRIPEMQAVMNVVRRKVSR